MSGFGKYGLASLLMLSTVAPVLAQETPLPGAIGCDHAAHGGLTMISCGGQGFDVCEKALATHRCTVHQICAGGSGQAGSALSPVRPPSGPVEAVVRGVAMGGLTGALLGSLANQTTNGAIGGAGALTAVYALTAPEIKPVARAVIATAAGAAVGNAWARYQFTQGKPDTTQRDTAIGAAAGLAVGFLGGFQRGKYGDAPSKPWSPAVVYAAALGVGAGAGAAAGQVWKTPGGDPQVAVGSLGGAATSSTFALLAKAGDMSWTGATLAGAVSGGAGGAAYGKWDADRGNEDRMAMYAAIGAGSGAVLGFLLSRAGGSNRPQTAAPLVPRRRLINAVITGRYAGAVIRW